MLSVSFCRLFRLYIMSVILLFSSLPFKTKYYEIVVYILCVFTPPLKPVPIQLEFWVLSPGLWNWSEYSKSWYHQVSDDISFAIWSQCSLRSTHAQPCPSCPFFSLLPWTVYVSLVSFSQAAPFSLLCWSFVFLRVCSFLSLLCENFL